MKPPRESEANGLLFLPTLLALFIVSAVCRALRNLRLLPWHD